MIAVYASGALGAVVAGTATFGAYLAVAGAALSTIGALTGEKGVARVGAILSLGGGIASLASGASSAASTAGAAEGAVEGAAALEATNAGAQVGADVGQAVSGTAPASSITDQVIEEAARSGAGGAVDTVVQPIGADSIATEAIADGAASLATQPAGFDYPDAFGAATPTETPIWERAAQAQPGATDAARYGGSAGPNDPLAEGARRLTSEQIDTSLDRSATAARVSAMQGTPAGQPLRLGSLNVQAPAPNYSLGGPAQPLRLGGAVSGGGGQVAASQTPILDRINALGSHIRDNKDMYLIGGNLAMGLAKGYMQGQQADAEMSIYERRRRALNSPVALTFGVR